MAWVAAACSARLLVVRGFVAILNFTRVLADTQPFSLASRAGYLNCFLVAWQIESVGDLG